MSIDPDNYERYASSSSGCNGGRRDAYRITTQIDSCLIKVLKTTHAGQDSILAVFIETIPLITTHNPFLFGELQNGDASKAVGRSYFVIEIFLQFLDLFLKVGHLLLELLLCVPADGWIAHVLHLPEAVEHHHVPDDGEDDADQIDCGPDNASKGGQVENIEKRRHFLGTGHWFYNGYVI